MENILKRNNYILKELTSRKVDSTSSLKTKLVKINPIICKLPKEIADAVLNEMLKECFNDKDFEGMTIICKMKENLKNL